MKTHSGMEHNGEVFFNAAQGSVWDEEEKRVLLKIADGLDARLKNNILMASSEWSGDPDELQDTHIKNRTHPNGRIYGIDNEEIEFLACDAADGKINIGRI